MTSRSNDQDAVRHESNPAQEPRRPEKGVVSIYMPTKDRPDLAARAIQSVVTQTYPAIQLVIVDDGSALQNAAQLADAVQRANADTKRSILLLRNETSQGACHARNLALSRCVGEFATGIDDDDYFLPNRIDHLLRAFDPDTSAFVFGGYLREMHDSTGKTRRRLVPLRQTATLERIMQQNMVGNQVLTLTERLRAIGGFDESLPAWQDHDMWIRLVKTFGAGSPAGGATYVHTVGYSASRISCNPERARKAYAIFRSKHPEYAADRLELCLRLALLNYGINSLAARDLPTLVQLRRPRLVASTLYGYFTARGGIRSMFR